MTRLQKKCMMFSLGLHGLLAVILIGSAGFGVNPQQTDLQVLSMIPANIVDRAGSGGETALVNPAPQPQPPALPRAQPQPQPKPQPQPQPPAVHVEPVHTEPTPPHRSLISRLFSTPDEPEKSDEPGLEPAPKPSKHPKGHEIHPSFEPASAATTGKKAEKSSASEAASAARAEARRLKEIENSLNDLASGVQSSGSPNTIVDVGGIGGGEAFASYRNVIFTYYYRAWTTPDSTSSRLGSADAKVTIARDGSIISAELVRPSGDRALDRSVERALRLVTKLPPFPASARDTQRTFTIQFSLEAKEMSG
jgi:TonB family protein